MVNFSGRPVQRPVPKVAKKHGANAQTIYAWRKHVGSWKLSTCTACDS